MQYLREEQYYVDIYDLFTIKDCLSTIDNFRKSYQEKLKEPKLSKEDKAKAYNAALNIMLYSIKGERYLRKEDSIKEMIEKDRIKQDLFDNTPEPNNITCDKCGNKLYSDYKVLDDFNNRPLKVLFFFPCTKCKTKRLIYNTGEEYEVKADICKKCGFELNKTYKRTGKIITTTYKCPNCDFREVQTENLESDNSEWEKEKIKDKKLLDKYRKEFCISEKDGQEYQATKVRLEQLNKMLDEDKRKKEDPAYQKAKTIKRLTIVQLEKLLSKQLNKTKYVKLVLEKPEFSKNVIVPFVVQDNDDNRSNSESISVLKKHLKTLLSETNWRLMSEGLTYRLGFVYGRLKGYETEDDIANLVRGSDKENYIY